jgi:hypothetical protein
MAKDNFNIMVGGGIITKEKLNELTEQDQNVLLATSAREPRWPRLQQELARVR